MEWAVMECSGAPALHSPPLPVALASRPTTQLRRHLGQVLPSRSQTHESVGELSEAKGL